MRSQWFLGILVGLASTVYGGAAYGAPVLDLSVYEIQSNTMDGDASIYNGQVHNVNGGIVTHVWHGWNDRVYLQDPDHPTWGAIVVKDGESGELANSVAIGDWVSFDNIYIDEFWGTTFLQYRRQSAPDVTFTVESTGHTLPAVPVLTAADLVVPVNHAASEPYESMIVTLENMTVGQMDLGKADDNYELIQGNDIAWGTDYMNMDAGGPYDPRIVTGAELLGVTGVVEQFTKLADDWDYYQLNTRFGADIVPEPGTLSLLAIAAGLIIARKKR